VIHVDIDHICNADFYLFTWVVVVVVAATAADHDCFVKVDLSFSFLGLCFCVDCD
jgi:hypothetical protein